MRAAGKHPVEVEDFDFGYGLFADGVKVASFAESRIGYREWARRSGRLTGRGNAGRTQERESSRQAPKVGSTQRSRFPSKAPRWRIHIPEFPSSTTKCSASRAYCEGSLR